MIETFSDALKVFFAIMLGYLGGRADSSNDDNVYIVMMIIFFVVFSIFKFLWKVI